jgi:hypothetical protein
VPVIAPALSDATKAAILPTSASVGSRLSSVLSASLRPAGNGGCKVLQGELDERDALDLIEADRIERDIDASGFLDHLVEMSFNGRLIQRVHLTYTRRVTGPVDLRRHPFERRQPAAGKEDLGAFAREGLGDGTPMAPLAP